MGLVDDAEVTAALSHLKWQRDGAMLVRVIRLADFAEAMTEVNKIGALAEDANHHPDIDIRWNVVTLRLTDHDAGGLSDKDLALAERIDAAVAAGPPEASA